MQRNFSMQQDHSGTINAMAHSGVGLWISLRHSSTICLYHTETFRHLQDINVASNVNRLVGKKHSRDVHVTALMASKGLLWVGTNVGIALSIPLPRLEGVPIISGRANVSHHAHSGPITVFLTMQMQSKPTNSPPHPSVSIPLPSSLPSSGTIQEESENESTSPRSKPLVSSINQLTTSHFNTVPKVRSPLLDSPLVLRRRSKESSPLLGKRMSRTLPRGHVSAATECDIFGLYGELMNIKDYEDGDGSGLMCGGSGTGAGTVNSMYETLRRSDPDLAAIPAKVSTLDRRLHMKAGRPRSLDLSNWSVDSRSSLYTSSGSEDSASQQMTPSATMLTIRQTSTLKHSQQHDPSTSKSSVDTPRTVLTLSGGCGYLYTHQHTNSVALVCFELRSRLLKIVLSTIALGKPIISACDWERSPCPQRSPHVVHRQAAATTVKADVVLTDTFAHKHQGLKQLFEKCARIRKSKWTVQVLASQQPLPPKATCIASTSDALLFARSTRRFARQGGLWGGPGSGSGPQN